MTTMIIAPANVTPELMLISFVATFMTVATVWILWSFLEKSEIEIDIRSFLTFFAVIVPFVMIIYFGLDAIIDDAVRHNAGLPTVLPLGLPEEISLLVVVYIGVWLGLRSRKLNLSKRDNAMGRGG